MMAFVSENLPTILGSVLVFGVFILIIAKQIRNRGQHKSGCGCGCAGCPNSGSCHPR